MLVNRLKGRRSALSLVLTGTDHYAFQSSTHAAGSPGRRRIESDLICRDYLTAIECGITRARDLAAEPAFHYASVITFLALSKSRRAMSHDLSRDHVSIA
jgi:hypothetical protein